jgi:hypothetical protein
MKTTIIASSLVLLSVLACAGPVQPATADAKDQPAAADTQDVEGIRWEVEREEGSKGQPKLRLSHRSSTSDLSLDGKLASERPEFGAARSALGGTGPVRFTVRHAAGTLDCRGTLSRAYDGKGLCSFAPDAGFERALDDRGLTLRRRSDLLAMLMVDATIELADGLTREGVAPKDSDDLIAAAALEVTPDYVRDLKTGPMTLTSVDDAIACKALEVDGAYVRGLAAAGYAKLSSDEVVGMKAMGVSPDYARSMNLAAKGRGQ